MSLLRLLQSERAGEREIKEESSILSVCRAKLRQITCELKELSVSNPSKQLARSNPPSLICHLDLAEERPSQFRNRRLPDPLASFIGLLIGHRTTSFQGASMRRALVAIALQIVCGRMRTATTTSG